MGNQMTPDLWLLLCILPCILGWALGRLYEGWRVGKIAARGTGRGSAAQPMVFSAPPIPSRRTRDPAAPIVAATNTSDQTASVPSKPFVQTPTLHELSLQAAEFPHKRDARIDERLSEGVLMPGDPLAARAIDDYRYAVAALRQTRRTDCIEPIGLRIFEYASDELPRIADIAPISPHMRASEIAARRAMV
ncbi:hypothetical protein FGU71_04305 [Erythrobacter insulae]|uniref:Uncharacterized protein n=1 Tax=Erythrobacter insulae TaxID=2584124 RepID=A0A547PAH4_9SPHN|nr:hypothetical protein [Erythrobacter insulae]TRD11149.1 hypothetical protein FGU71_04305 [Erythrobacter insulae]